MSKEITLNNDARLELMKGIDKLANTVKVTLGPMGRNVIIEHQYGYPTTTKDGISVAEQIILKDPLQNIGAQLVKQVASKTADEAGDGTTTATVLAQSIFKNGINSITAGAKPVKIKKGIEKAVKVITSELIARSKKVTTNKEIEQIATISANNDYESGRMIAKAMEQVGKDGVITIEESSGTDTEVKIVNGMQIPSGLLSPYFITNESSDEIIFEDAFILFYDKAISSMVDVLPILELVVQAGKPLLIISNDIDGEALSTMVVNNAKGAIKIAAIKAPYIGEIKKDTLQDIATITNGTVVAESRGYKLKDAQIDMLGIADKIIVSKTTTTIINNNTNQHTKDRIASIREKLKTETASPLISKLKVRLARLTGGVAIIKIGATTEMEMKEKKDRLDDALHATTAAVKEGIIPGGGLALVRASEKLQSIKTSSQDEEIGVNIVRKAILTPMKTIADNAEINFERILHNIENKEYQYGFNMKSEKYENLIESGVIDPTKVTRLALQNAASVAALLLTTQAVITESVESREIKE